MKTRKQLGTIQQLMTGSMVLLVVFSLFSGALTTVAHAADDDDKASWAGFEWKGKQLVTKGEILGALIEVDPQEGLVNVNLVTG